MVTSYTAISLLTLFICKQDMLISRNSKDIENWNIYFKNIYNLLSLLGNHMKEKPGQKKTRTKKKHKCQYLKKSMYRSNSTTFPVFFSHIENK